MAPLVFATSSSCFVVSARCFLLHSPLCPLICVSLFSLSLSLCLFDCICCIVVCAFVCVCVCESVLAESPSEREFVWVFSSCSAHASFINTRVFPFPFSLATIRSLNLCFVVVVVFFFFFKLLYSFSFLSRVRVCVCVCVAFRSLVLFAYSPRGYTGCPVNVPLSHSGRPRRLRRRSNDDGELGGSVRSSSDGPTERPDQHGFERSETSSSAAQPESSVRYARARTHRPALALGRAHTHTPTALYRQQQQSLLFIRRSSLALLSLRCTRYPR